MEERFETAFAQKAIQENLEYFKKRFLDREDGYQFDYPPRIIDIHLGWKGAPCENKCVFCYDSKYGYAKLAGKYGPEQVAQLSSELDKAIDWKKDGFKIKEVYLAGGVNLLYILALLK